ncbi:MULTISPECIES: CDP-glycerol glycerophosphotransferase family protein [Bacillus]|uniref:Spore coat protein n=2 Tax=Bacillus wiedmannii TaxID=1890302 RepID=A0A2A8BTJ8_9BACI|nr:MULTISPECIES: CDP-glycerol glycerophosphotransferase family protein [Bacillus]MBY7112616.1 CDP-glycerol glycerophosphotransferase family protein [Bacillus sp. 17RED48]MBY7124462.1 CDP-glycerol glycerophosphotransferase family protein [Bacillus sp. 16GRE42]MCR6847140.1 CDP-glycerol glycerophosphotransferase family protein [Bacillus sp. IBL03825]MCX3316015.1 CDP-glycerol glycerophosphotransferase family protein [Bacillus wiedmannii]PEM58012.1 spore coat protein [Bacillus wiedmannii]
MSDIYLKNYWLLNLEYINVFSELKHYNIPLPLLSNFYQYLDADVKNKMKENNLNKQLSIEPIEEMQLQLEFEKIMSSFQSKIKSKNRNGTILLNSDYLRFSVSNFTHFNPNQTKILTRSKKTELYGLPTICAPDYINKASNNAHVFIEKAKEIFLKFNKHPLFSNMFFQKKLISDLPIMIEKLNMAYFIFKEQDISGVIVGTTEDIASRALTFLSRSEGIPSYCLQHGAIMGEEAYFPVFATKQVVYGKYEQDWYLQRGGSESQIEILGHPRYDEIFNRTYMDKKELFKTLKIDPTTKVIFIATQPFKTSFYTELTEKLVKDKKITVIIKPHPWEKGRNLVGEYIKLSNLYPNVKYITNEVNMYDVILHANLVVISNSTVGLEAMLLDIPVVVYKSLLEDRDYKYYDTLDGLVNHSIEDLLSTVEKVLNDSSQSSLAKELRRKFINENYPQEACTKRLINLIQSEKD